MEPLSLLLLLVSTLAIAFAGAKGMLSLILHLMADNAAQPPVEPAA